MATVKPVPEGMHTLTPHLICKGAAEAIEWYKKAFGAVELHRMLVPGTNTIMHAAVRIGDSTMMLAEEAPQWKAPGANTLGNSPVTLHLYVANTDATVKQAEAAGAKVAMPPMDMFWGDRYGKIIDPFGHHWSIATKIRDVTPAEMAEAAAKMFSKPMEECK